MINRLLDKSIIVILSAALVLFGTVPYGSFSLSSDIGTKEVVTILTVFIIALLEEVIRNRIVGMLLVVASGALAAYMAEMSVLIPICIYGMFSDENTEKSFLEFHKAKNSRAFVSEIFAQRISWLKLLLLAGTAGIACRHWSVFLIVAAAILAIKTAYMNTQ